MKNLSEKVVLVNLSISQWSARKHDKAISKKIEKDHNAHNAGRYNKILIAEDGLKETQRLANGARAFFYENTLAWGDNGDRLLPTTNYFQFVNKFGDMKLEFDSAARQFIRQYPDLKEDAKRRLNGMFKEEDYPTVVCISQKFSIDISFMPIADTKDFRLQVNQEEVATLKRKIESEITSRVNMAIKDMWDRVKEAVSHMVERLADKDAVFRDSLVTNIRELIALLPRLNFTEDKDIEEILRNMKRLDVDPEALRNNTNLRHQKAREAKAILDKINDFLE